MKVSLIFLAILGLTRASTFVLEAHKVKSHAVNTQSLQDLYDQFVAFIPVDDCVAIVRKYEANDPDVKAAYDFLRSDKFQALVDNIRTMPEFKSFVQFLNDAGFDYYRLLNFMRSIIDLPPLTPKSQHKNVKESGLVTMVKEIMSIIPIEDIKTWFFNICWPDPDFQALVAKLQSPELGKLVETIYNSPEYQELGDMLREQGIDVEAIEKAINDFLNSKVVY